MIKQMHVLAFIIRANETETKNQKLEILKHLSSAYTTLIYNKLFLAPKRFRWKIQAKERNKKRARVEFPNRR